MPDHLHGRIEGRSAVEPHDHAVFVYDDEADILEPLEHFLFQGARARDLSVFVHSFGDNEEARDFLGRRIADLPKYEESGELTTARHVEAFERNGRIDHEHVGHIVGMLHATAKRGGRRAPHIFVDASKSYIGAGRADEWFEFESWLGRRLQAEAGLVCAYRASHLEDPEILARVLATHAYRFDAPSPASD